MRWEHIPDDEPNHAVTFVTGVCVLRVQRQHDGTFAASREVRGVVVERVAGLRTMGDGKAAAAAMGETR